MSVQVGKCLPNRGRGQWVMELELRSDYWVLGLGQPKSVIWSISLTSEGRCWQWKILSTHSKENNQSSSSIISLSKSFTLNGDPGPITKTVDGKCKLGHWSPSLPALWHSHGFCPRWFTPTPLTGSNGNLLVTSGMSDQIQIIPPSF